MGSYYLIKPSLTWWNTGEFKKLLSNNGEIVKDKFEYSSETNKKWLNVDKLTNIIRKINNTI